MQQESRLAPTAAAASFAGLLAALAAPRSAAEATTTVWNEDAFEDDVATLSYERALRAHARYRPGDATPSDSAGDSGSESPGATRISAASPLPQTHAEVAPQVALNHSTALERNLKSTSITIRMSRAECEQLRKRALDAGLTVSAYLRSCTFEAESLRAQVKEALTRLRTSESVATALDPTPARRSWFRWPSRA
jgi:predicted DNA binding CopG/RHH family protein